MSDFIFTGLVFPNNDPDQFRDPVGAFVANDNIKGKTTCDYIHTYYPLHQFEQLVKDKKVKGVRYKDGDIQFSMSSQGNSDAIVTSKNKDVSKAAKETNDTIKRAEGTEPAETSGADAAVAAASAGTAVAGAFAATAVPAGTLGIGTAGTAAAASTAGAGAVLTGEVIGAAEAAALTTTAASAGAAAVAGTAIDVATGAAIATEVVGAGAGAAAAGAGAAAAAAGTAIDVATGTAIATTATSAGAAAAGVGAAAAGTELAVVGGAGTAVATTATTAGATAVAGTVGTVALAPVAIGVAAVAAVAGAGVLINGALKAKEFYDRVNVRFVEDHVQKASQSSKYIAASICCITEKKQQHVATILLYGSDLKGFHAYITKQYPNLVKFTTYNNTNFMQLLLPVKLMLSPIFSCGEYKILYCTQMLQLSAKALKKSGSSSGLEESVTESWANKLNEITAKNLVQTASTGTQATISGSNIEAYAKRYDISPDRLPDEIERLKKVFNVTTEEQLNAELAILL